jgi:tryptophan 2,3-dioxygenase
MPRHPEQDAALSRYYKSRKDNTREVFSNAMDRLLRGEPLYTNGKLTEANLCREAERSRATLTRYPEIKRTFSEAKRNRNKTAPTNLVEKVRELEDTLRELRRGDNLTIKSLIESRNRLAQEVFVQYCVIELLRREKNEFEVKLQEALKGVRLRLVTAGDEEESISI